jgi:DNA polymerase III delta subunit
MATCSRCSTDNPADARFCVACGAPIGPEWHALDRFLDEQLVQKIRTVLKAEFADQKALEIETSELVADRVLKWAKTFGFFIGIPVAIAIGFLGFVGIKTWSDVTSVRDNLAKASADLASAQKELASANQRTQEILTDADKFKDQVRQAREQLAEIPEL